MRNIKKIFIVVFSLILLFAVSCSNDDKTGVKNNPPENDTEITDGETGSGSSSGGSSETGTGGETGGSGSESETGEGGTGGSEEGEGGTETPPSETETTETIDAKDFPENLKGTYRDENVNRSYGKNSDTKVSSDETTKKTKIKVTWLKEGATSPDAQTAEFSIEKWKKTTKGGKIIKLEGESSDGSGGKYTVTYDYITETLISKYIWSDGTTYSFNGKKQPTE